MLGALSITASGCRGFLGGDDDDIIAGISSSTGGYSIDSANVKTTREQRIVPITPTGASLRPEDIASYSENGYGKWSYGPGIDSGRLTDIMPAGFNSGAITNVAKLLRFFTISDVHITDKESPAQLIYMHDSKFGLGANAISVYAGVMLFSTHVLDAAIQTVNAISRKNTIDFGLCLGDAGNSAQYNELRWFIDVMDGKIINPDSGDKDDPIPGPLNDYQDEYQAAGLDKSIPWYQVLGNHDQFWMGSKFVSDTAQAGHIARSDFTGTEILNKGIVHLPGGIDQTGFYMGSLDGRTPYGTIFGAGPVASFTTPPTVPADPKRRPVTRREWMNEFFTTTSEPVGHGFSQSNLADDFACYSFMPKSSIPLKVIVLDNTVRENAINPSTQISGYGYLDQKRFDWLVSELKEGQDNNKLMIVAAHIPFGVEPAGSPAGFLDPATEAALIQELHNHPNVLMFLAGHRHVNLIKPFPSPDPTKPEGGFWQVETCSLREFPQEFRTFEIRRNSDKTISILVTNVDPAVKEGTPAATSRSYAIAALQAFGFNMSDPRFDMGNAELLKPLTATMAAVLENYGTAIH